MKNLDLSVYKNILAVRQAHLFDIGCFLMRIYMYMGTLGIVSMLTLSGHSALFSGTVSSALAISTFFISPRTGKYMDERGQHQVILITSIIAMTGAVLLLAAVSRNLPPGLMYAAAFLMGFVPSAPAIARTRWTYLIETGKVGDFSPSLKSVYSYEGVIEDCAFMIGPALAIALSNSLFPTAGILLGCVCFIVGSFILLTFARTTEPQVNWHREENKGSGSGARGNQNAKDATTTAAAVPTTATTTAAKTSDAATAAPATCVAPEKKHRIALLDIPVVGILFLLALLVGMLFGCFDTTTITFAQAIGQPNVASIGVSISSFISMCSSLTFGMLVFKSPLSKQLIVAACAIGLGYMGMTFITSVPLFYTVSFLGAVFYAPFFITANSFCEQAVPANRLTESLTWISAGTTCGLAIGPTASGAVIDMLGSTAGFYLGSAACAAVIVVALLSRNIIKNSQRKA